MKRIIIGWSSLTVAILASGILYTNSSKATSPPNTVRDVVILQPYEKWEVVNGVSMLKGMYVYVSSSSSNSPSFNNYPNNTLPIAQALSDCLTQNFTIRDIAATTGIYTLVR